MASSSPQQTSLVPGKAEAPAAPKPETKKPEKKISDIGKKISDAKRQEPEAASPFARMLQTNDRILVMQERILNRLEGIHNSLRELQEALSKKTGIFQVAASGQQTKPKQQEKAPQPADDLAADLKDLCKEDRQKLVSCPGGVKLKHFFPDKTVWTHMNYDIMEPKGYKWIKDEKVSKNSHWEKGT